MNIIFFVQFFGKYFTNFDVPHKSNLERSSSRKSEKQNYVTQLKVSETVVRSQMYMFLDAENHVAQITAETLE